MSERRARYVGPSETGVDITYTLQSGEARTVHVRKGGEFPTEIAGEHVSAAYRDSLLEQSDNWTTVRRTTGSDAKKGDS